MRSFIFIAVYLCRACSARSLRWACASRSATRRRSPVANATIITRRHDITHRTNISLIIYFNNATSLWQPANNVHHRWRTAPIFLLLYSFSITRGKTTKHHLKRKCFFYFRLSVNNSFGVLFLVRVFVNYFYYYLRTQWKMKFVFDEVVFTNVHLILVFFCYDNTTWLYVRHVFLSNIEKD